MGYMDAILHFVGPTGGVSLVGIGMIRLEEFGGARVLFWCGAILFAVSALGWQFTTLAPWWLRVPSGTIAGIVVLVVFPGLQEWLKKLALMVGAGALVSSPKPHSE